MISERKYPNGMKDKKNINKISSDEAICEMLENLEEDVSNVFSRAKSLKPCPIGSSVSGICCKNCSMGPCRVNEKNAGLCGATLATIAARNLEGMLLQVHLLTQTTEEIWLIFFSLHLKKRQKA
jgi:hydroxylamine reductase (hybrid-cluster protein)